MVWTLSTWTKLLTTHRRRACPWTCRPITTPACLPCPILWLLPLTRLLSSSRRRIISSLCCKTLTDNSPEINTHSRYFRFQRCVHSAYLECLCGCRFGNIPLAFRVSDQPNGTHPEESWNNWGVYVTWDCCSPESGLSLCARPQLLHVRLNTASLHFFFLAGQWTQRWYSQHVTGSTQKKSWVCPPMQGHHLTDEHFTIHSSTQR